MRQDKDRIDGTELAIEGDRLLARDGEVEQCPPAPQRAREADRLDGGVFHQCLAGRIGVGLDQREDASRLARRLDRVQDRFRNDFRRAGMGRMALDHYRATGGQRRSGVAAGRRESQREVRRTEHADRADRPLNEPDFRARRRLAVGHGRVVTAVEIGAVADMAGKEPQLARGAAALTFEPRGGSPLSRVPMSVMAGPRFSIASAIASRKAARSSRRDQP